MASTRAQLRTHLMTRLQDSSNSKWSISTKNEAINVAIQMAFPAWFQDAEERITVYDDEKLEWSLTATMYDVLECFHEQAVNYDEFTLTGGTSTTATVAGETWTTDMYVGWSAVITAGTGEGSYGIVTANSSTAVTVARWSGTGVTPAVGDTLCLNDITGAMHRSRLRTWRTDARRNPTSITMRRYFDLGDYLIVHYVAKPTELTTDATENLYVDDEYIIRQAAAILHQMRLQTAPASATQTHATLAGMYQQLADDYRRRQGRHYPSRTIRRAPEDLAVPLPSDYPWRE